MEDIVKYWIQTLTRRCHCGLWMRAHLHSPTGNMIRIQHGNNGQAHLTIPLEHLNDGSGLSYLSDWIEVMHRYGDDYIVR